MPEITCSYAELRHQVIPEASIRDVVKHRTRNTDDRPLRDPLRSPHTTNNPPIKWPPSSPSLAYVRIPGDELAQWTPVPLPRARWRNARCARKQRAHERQLTGLQMLRRGLITDLSIALGEFRAAPGQAARRRS